jgi:CRP-like cAMP-binding protein
MSSTQSLNYLLAGLSPGDFEILRPNLRPVDLPLRRVLETPSRPVQHVFFLETGIASVVAVQSRETRVEVGLIGREGMTGLSVVLGDDQTPNQTYMQVAGAGLQITADLLREGVARSAGIQKVALKFVHSFVVQASQTAITNAHGRLEERLSRWILMAHDRGTGSTIHLTHEFLSLMLGVRRAGVTEALHALVKRGLVTSARGAITVMNRGELESSAGDSYGVPEAEYRRLFGNWYGNVQNN